MSTPASSPVILNAPSTNNLATTGLLLLLTGIGYHLYQATQLPIITVSRNAYITKKSSIMIGFCNNFFWILLQLSTYFYFCKQSFIICPSVEQYW